jgi:hypothetical protein
VSATGNVSGGNINTAGVVSATGNVSGGNITSTGLIQGKIVTSNVITGFTYNSGNGVYSPYPAGTAGQIVVDTANNKLIICTTTGNAFGGTAPLAVWKSATLS